jgi:hypothetical protein
MKPRVLIVMTGALALFLLVGIVAADNGTTSVSYGDPFEALYEPGEDGTTSLIQNGDFSQWNDDGTPVGWGVWADTKAGWEPAHVGRADMAFPGAEQANDALTLFVRNVGGEGSYYAGVYNLLDQIPAAGDYWVTIHGTAWGEYLYFDSGDSRFTQAAYNAIAWYGFGDSADPASVTDWRELPLSWWADGVALICNNDDSVCSYMARNETRSIEPGQYLHLKVGHKFPHFNDWTVFLFDDISIIPATDEFIADGFTMDGLVGWDPNSVR